MEKHNEECQAAKEPCGMHKILRLECCTCSGMRFYCGNGRVVLLICAL